MRYAWYIPASRLATSKWGESMKNNTRRRNSMPHPSVTLSEIGYALLYTALYFSIESMDIVQLRCDATRNVVQPYGNSAQEGAPPPAEESRRIPPPQREVAHNHFLSLTEGKQSLAVKMENNFRKQLTAGVRASSVDTVVRTRWATRSL